MALPRFHVTERQVLMMLMGVTLFTVVAAFLWSAVLTGNRPKLESSTPVRWMRPPPPGSHLEAPYLIAEYFDPSAMSLPSPHGFSMAAWRHLAPPALESFDPERTPSYLAPPSGLQWPVLLEETPLEGLVQAGLEPFAAEDDAASEAPVELLDTVTNSAIKIGGDLRRRTLLRNPNLPLAPPNVAARVARVQVAVAMDGRVRYAVLDKSSGNNALDTEAVEIARQLQFAMESAVDPLELTWGTVRFFWASASGP
jgi:TonB family protein